MSDYARLCPVVSLARESKSDKYSLCAANARNQLIRAIRCVIAQGMDMLRFRTRSLRPALVVLATTILALIESAIVLPPKGSQAKPGEGGGEAPVTAPH